MKNFEIYINDTYTVGLTGYSAIEVAQDEIEYEIIDRKSGAGLDDLFTVEVTYEDTSAILTIAADTNIYLNELDDIIWEAIAEEFVTETK
ncbi:hypothetical protein U7154_000040 [Kononvirus KKP3711]|uniref:Uncharacterized protein n=1 Tax=Enterobacter phage KKP_3711 TaxID=3109398 RepID=A0AAX4Q5E5_9CAUD